ncbi:uncharacterized protein [Solanum lycopersicum]|uniref:uncharacterized protein n=1 Tax=Solanum lycopersicum TaxID=4081 RepID=UPI003748BD5B
MDFDFMEGELVLLEVSPMKGVMQFGKQVPPGLSGVHPVFNVSMLKNYHADENNIIRWDSVLLDKNLSYEEDPIAILDRGGLQIEIKRDCFYQSSVEESASRRVHFESEANMNERYPNLFTDSGTLSPPHLSFDHSRTNDG